MNKRRSLFALDWVNFFVADVETGVGPFMATYFSSVRHWNPQQIGFVLAAQKVAALTAQTPAGWLVDRSDSKRLLLILAALAVSAGSFFIVGAQSVAAQCLNQIGIGISTDLIIPIIAAISLGVVGHQMLAKRVGRNEGFNHFGNVSTALTAGYVGHVAGQQWIFYICAVLGLAAAVSALFIRPSDVDNEVARAAPEKGSERSHSFRDLIGDRRTLIFAVTVVLFHIANAAMLPLAGQELAAAEHGASASYMSAAIVAAQLIMIPTAVAAGRMANRVGRKPIFIVGFLALLLRGVLFAIGRGAMAIVAIEGLDGIGTGISGVLTVLIIADLARGTGRFNLLQGMVQSCLSLGSFIGNLSAGAAAKAFGFQTTFVCLAVVAAIGLAIFAFSMPETFEPA